MAAVRALVADDECDLLYVLREVLERRGLHVTTADNGLEAVRLIREGDFDLVLTDLLMPGADGLEVLREARSLPHEVLVVIITGHASLDSAIEAVRQGAYDYIRKPFRLEELELVIANACERIGLMWENRVLAGRLAEALARLEGVIPDSEEAYSGLPFYSNPEAALQAGGPPTTGRGLTQAPLIQALERFATLRQKDILSQEEFELCKRSLLKRL
jgi:DNA-binding NtrC family response regulator